MDSGPFAKILKISITHSDNKRLHFPACAWHGICVHDRCGSS